MLYATFQIDSQTNQLIWKQVEFRIVEEVKGKLNVSQVFVNDRRNVIGFETSQVENKMVKFKILDT